MGRGERSRWVGFGERVSEECTGKNRDEMRTVRLGIIS